MSEIFNINDKDVHRFWSKVAAPDSKTGCMNWTAGKFSTGYGAIVIARKVLGSHRVAWMITNGPIPDSLRVCHTCDNPSCCNPAHMFLGTITDNARDMVNKHRAANGERNGQAKLTADQVRAIRTSDEPCRAIAMQFGISRSQAWNIKTGKFWQHIK